MGEALVDQHRRCGPGGGELGGRLEIQHHLARRGEARPRRGVDGRQPGAGGDGDHIGRAALAVDGEAAGFGIDIAHPAMRVERHPGLVEPPRQGSDDAAREQHAGALGFECLGDAVGAQHRQAGGDLRRRDRPVRDAHGVELAGGRGVPVGGAAGDIEQVGRQIVGLAEVAPQRLIGAEGMRHQRAIAAEPAIGMPGDAVLVEGRADRIGDRPLLVERDAGAAPDQRPGERQAADPAADDCNVLLHSCLSLCVPSRGKAVRLVQRRKGHSFSQHAPRRQSSVPPAPRFGAYVSLLSIELLD